ncbi:extracellular solute-binding protein [Massilia aerilata]|uniref:Extracellular solute-binding protein n=1 Tax=Massilia aerilata TaxID=453817 RepID=A0ABW0RSB9_9BURK
MARRGWTLAAAVALLVTLAAGPAPAWAQVEVRMWTLLSGGDGARMRALVEDFNASQREVRVVSTTLKWGEPFYTKLITSSVVGAGPDLATVHLSRLVNLAGGGVLRPIADAELAAVGLKGSDYLPRQWEKSRWQGRTWAVPLDMHPLVLYYNKTLLKQTNLLDADGKLKPIEGVDALTDAFRIATEASHRRGLTMESSQNSFAIWRLWLSMLAQQNVAIVRKGQYSYGAAGAATLTRISDWFRKGYAQAGLDYPASTSQFMGGGAAFMLNGVWEVPELVRASKAGTLGFEYGIVPLPKMYANASAWADSHAFAMPANAGDPPSPAKVKAILAFVAWVGKHSMGWAEGGHIPAYRAVAESPEALALQPNAQYAEAAHSVVYDPDGWYMGAAGPLEAIASKFLPAALYGYMTPAQAIHRFETEGARLVRKQPPRY